MTKFSNVVAAGILAAAILISAFILNSGLHAVAFGLRSVASQTGSQPRPIFNANFPRTIKLENDGNPPLHVRVRLEE